MTWNPLLAEIDPAVFATLIAALLGGGGFGALLAYKRTSSEADSIAASTLIAVNTELRVELARKGAEIAALRERVAVLEHEIHPRGL